MNSAKDPASRPKFTIAWDWKLSLLCILTLPVLLSLGFWQLERAEQKRARQMQLERQQVLPPALLSTVPAPQLGNYRRVIARGRFDQERYWLLDNRHRQGRVGYEVIAPFYLEEGGALLVNRGWTPAGATRAERPEAPPPSGQVSLFAELVPTAQHPLLEGIASGPEWPKVIVALEPEVMARQLGEPLPKRYLRLDDGSPGALIAAWPAARVGVQKHLGYAFQWFAMALGVILWFVFANSNLWQWLRPGQRDEDGPNP